MFLDTSALVKRYIEEPGSDVVVELLAEADGLVVSALCLPECVSAFRRLDREDLLAPGEYEGLKRHLIDDLGDAVVCHIVPQVLELTVECLERQAEAARAEGLTVRVV